MTIIHTKRSQIKVLEQSVIEQISLPAYRLTEKPELDTRNMLDTDTPHTNMFNMFTVVCLLLWIKVNHFQIKCNSWVIVVVITQASVIWFC